ncbi:MAG: hypothetical protein HQL25_05375 [Candidatus Omnitrophica bacterium]|nr:hypothetical protein [Candidatus Omnitrophota bacterium]
MKEFKRTNTKKLGEVLVERGVINHQQLNKALEIWQAKGGLMGEILVELKFATEEDIAQALTCQYGFPFLPLNNYEVDPVVMKSVSRELCVKYVLVPIDKIGKSITLAMANPLNTMAIEELETLTECSIQVFVSTTTEIKKFLEKNYME